MNDAFEDEGIYTIPNPDKIYRISDQINIARNLKNITHLIKLILLYDMHHYLLTNIKELIQNNTTINKECNTGLTALILASKKGYFKIVKMLLKHPNIDPNSHNIQEDNTALHLATLKNNDKIVELLLKHPNIYPNLSNTYGQSPLHLAILEHNYKIVKLLLEHPDINPNITKYYTPHPLSLASDYGYTEIVKILLKHPDINLNLQDSRYGDTVLLNAAMYDRDDIIIILLHCPNINPILQNYDDASTIDYVKNKKIKILLQYTIHNWHVQQHMSKYITDDLHERILFSFQYHQKKVILNNTVLSFSL